MFIDKARKPGRNWMVMYLLDSGFAIAGSTLRLEGQALWNSVSKPFTSRIEFTKADKQQVYYVLL